VVRGNTKPVKFPKTLRVMAPSANPNQDLRVTILDKARIGVKDDTTTRIDKLSGRKQVHEKGVERVPRLATERGVPSSVSTRRLT
jgi:hypothetical protein